ncbi:MAG: extracellular solute-binding protein [Nitrososphaeria archaeon]
MHFSKSLLVIILIILILTPLILFYGHPEYFVEKPVNVKIAFLSHYLAPDFISFKNLINRWNPYFEKMGFYVSILDIDRESALKFLLSSQNSSVDIVVVSNFNFKKIVPYLVPLNFSSLAERFYEKAVNPFNENEKVYAIPFHASFPILFYNKNYITAPPQSFDQLLTFAKNFSKKYNQASPTEYGLAIYSLEGKHSALVFQSLYETFGGQLLANNFTVRFLSNETLENLLGFYQVLVEEEISPPGSLYSEFSVLNDLFAKKSFPLMIQWNYAIPFLSENFTINDFGLAPLPSISVSSTSIGYVLAFGVCKFSKNQKYSVKFLESIYSNDLIKELVLIGAFPPIKGLSNIFNNLQIRSAEEIFRECYKNCVYEKYSNDFYETFSKYLVWCLEKRISEKDFINLITNIQYS